MADLFMGFAMPAYIPDITENKVLANIGLVHLPFLFFNKPTIALRTHLYPLNSTMKWIIPSLFNSFFPLMPTHD